MGFVELSVALGVAAGVIQLVGYIVYVRTAATVNAGSWAIWTFGAILDVVSYAAMTDDWVKNILPAVCAIACIYTFLRLLMSGRFEKPDTVDSAFFLLDSAITIVWWQWATAVIANLLYQVSTLASFVPIVRAQVHGTVREKPLPWILWTMAYALFTWSVALRLDKWEELAYPGVHLLTHTVVMCIALAKLRPSQ